ncbi:MAG TPA: universal stress protein [Solirubrobacterales bacterium]|nr:universal stress protein [Solirubrobacterales bacterium]
MFSRILVGYGETERSADALALAHRLAEVLGTGLVDPGPVSYETLRRLNADDPAGLVVIGSAPRALPGTVLPASVGRAVLTPPTGPVAIAPLGFADGAPARLHQLGIAYDGSRGADAALEIGTGLAIAAEARLELLAVAEPRFEVPPAGIEDGDAGTGLPQLSPRTRLELAASKALSRIPPEVGAVEEAVYGIPTRTLLSRTAALDLMLLGSRGDVGSGRPPGRVCKGLLVGGAGCPLIVAPFARRHEHPWRSYGSATRLTAGSTLG